MSYQISAYYPQFFSAFRKRYCYYTEEDYESLKQHLTLQDNTAVVGILRTCIKEKKETFVIILCLSVAPKKVTQPSITRCERAKRRGGLSSGGGSTVLQNMQFKQGCCCFAFDLDG